MKKGVTLYILIGLIAGIVVGVLLNAVASDPADLKGVVTVFDTVTTIFLRLVRTIISPLVITTLTLAMARNEVLQIVVFSLFAGIGTAHLSKEHRDTLVHVLDAGAALMLKITMYVMWVAPAAVFTSIASAVASQGAGVVSNYAAFIGEFYLALAILWAVLIAIGGAIIGNRIWPLMKAIRAPALIAFSPTRPAAAHPP